MPPESAHKKIALIAVGLSAAAILVVAVGYANRSTVAMPQNQTQATLPRPAAPTASLGGQVYESVANPVSGAMPQTNPFAESTNPIEQSYTNPFQ